MSLSFSVILYSALGAADRVERPFIMSSESLLTDLEQAV
jgi:hypothetical protein